VPTLTKSLDNSAGLSLLTQEYRAALHALLSERLPTEVYLRRVEELKSEYERQRDQEMKAIREQ
jgi:hypothetical protein